MPATVVPALERRKKSLRSFYKTRDPGRIKNIDPLFAHFSFEQIVTAIKKKYKELPENWEYERFFDLVGHVPQKKITNAMKKQGLNPEVVFQNVTPSRKTKAKDRSTDVLIQRRPPPATPKQQARGTRVLIKRETQASVNVPRPPPPPHNRPSIDFDADSSDDEDFNVSALFRDARAPSSKRLRHKDFSMRASAAEYDNAVSGDIMTSGPIRRVSSGALRTRPTKGSRGTKPAPPPPSYDAPGSPTRRTNAMGRNTTATHGFTRGDSSNKLRDPRQNKRNKPSFAQIPVPGVPEGFEPVDDDEDEVDLTKYRKMQKTGLPEGAIRNALVRDGLDPGLFDKLAGGSGPSKTVSAPNIRQAPKKTIEKTNTTGNINAPKKEISKPKGLGEKHAMLNNLFGLKPADPAPKKEVSKPKGLGEKHAMLNNLFGLKPADEKPKATPKPRETSAEQSGGAPPKQTKISSKFAGMHALLAKQMGGGGGGGGGAAKKPEVKVDTEKAKAVAAKFAGNKNKNLKAVVPGSPEYEKYKRMQKNKLPEGAIRNCLERDGFDPDSFFNGGASSPAPRATKNNPMNSLAVPKSQQRNTQMPANNQNVARNTQVKNQNAQPQNNGNRQTQQNGQYQQSGQYPQSGQQQYHQNNQRTQSQHNMQAHPSQRNMQNQRQQSQHNVRGYASQTQMYYDPSYVQGQYHDPRATGYVGKYVPEPQISGSRVNDAWSIEWSQEYKRPYYFNRYTGESTWDPPADM